MRQEQHRLAPGPSCGNFVCASRPLAKHGDEELEALVGVLPKPFCALAHEGDEGMTTIKWRAISAILLSVALAAVFWLVPRLEPATFSASANGTIVVFGALFAVFWLYLVVQGYPVSHGDIGSSSTHNLDNIISAFPALVALFGIFVSVVGFWSLSSFNIVIAVMTLLVTLYDLWILGGSAAKINRLTDS